MGKQGNRRLSLIHIYLYGFNLHTIHLAKVTSKGTDLVLGPMHDHAYDGNTVFPAGNSQARNDQA